MHEAMHLILYKKKKGEGLMKRKGGEESERKEKYKEVSICLYLD